MARSMTGYGRGECARNNRKFVVELKSVNHRYCDFNIHIPRLMNPFEDRLKRMLAAELSRGKVDVYVTFETTAAGDVKIQRNDVFASAYISALSEMRRRYKLSGEISVELLSRFSEIFSVERAIDDAQVLGELWETLEDAARMALEGLAAMRESEGDALKGDILDKLVTIQSLAKDVGVRAPLVSAEYSEKLRARMAELLESYALDEPRLLTEITLFADRVSVDEELTRLNSHIRQLGAILAQDGPIGRKLDFLAQELNREVNTIGAKSNDLTISKLVVELKNEVEKIREQVQNIE
ncbi:MAG: YicC family protein [Clostridiales bacterium]|jgi:uncharacterized protein (TIGR00255 family)|nr:YicC family protein [Clostridiales bacterium]